MPDEKIKAVIIIGLKSGERIMKDFTYMPELERFLINMENLLNTDVKTHFFGPQSDFYLNGQRHISVYSILCSQIESVSFTKTAGG